MTEDCPWDLLVALCLRDMAGLADLGEPVLPAVTPAVPAVAHTVLRPGRTGGTGPGSADKDGGGGHRGALRAQWLAWWARTATPGTRPYVSDLRPPHFAAFDRQLELQDLIETHYVAAARWADRRREEYLRTRSERRAAFAADVVEPVREREHALRRQAGYFRLDLCVLPLAERGTWVIAPDTIAISRGLREDLPAFRAWWRRLAEVLV